MKFKDFEYRRPEINEYKERFEKLFSEFENASGAAEQYEIILKINAVRKDFSTMRTIGMIRYKINTEDKFYKDENNYFNNSGPEFAEFINAYYKLLINSKFRDELESLTGKFLFTKANLFFKTFRPEIIEDLKVENHLSTEYMRLIASATIMFDGGERNLSEMMPFLQSENREFRKRAAEARWKFFDDNASEFDRLYDELVKVRTKIARKLGYENFIQLGYDGMSRTDYTPKDVEKFRKAVEKFIVPVAQSLKEIKKKRIGLDKLYYYDAAYNFKDGNPTPKGTPEEIIEKARIMYGELSEDTKEFFDFLADRQLMDLETRAGKAGGGSCMYIANYESPFIFANMNGTADDVKVLTHEAGHAFQKYQNKDFEILEYTSPSMEAAEIFSMAMEYITIPWMGLFFEEDTDKFIYSHLSSAINFIPYGVTVDEFQHRVYENPDATPEDRKRFWRETEKKYLPDIDYSDNEFLDRGGFWFAQMHIFMKPFYYIDYCLAEICALQFWRKGNHDRDIAWDDYMNLCKAGGSKPFLELIKIAKLDSPFEGKSIESIVKYCEDWIESVSQDFVISQE